MSNADIRKAAKDAGVYLYEVAAAYGVNDGNFSRKLRWELPDDERSKIMGIIFDLAKKKGGAAINAEADSM